MLTPIDIENKDFKKSLRGYKEDDVDEFLDIVKEDFETLYRENLDLKEKIKLYQEQVSRYKSIEETLNKTLLDDNIIIITNLMGYLRYLPEKNVYKNKKIVLISENDDNEKYPNQIYDDIMIRGIAVYVLKKL